MIDATTTTLTTVFTQQTAIELADKLNCVEEDRWEYCPIHIPAGKGYSYVEVLDEDGCFLGKL